MTTTKLALFVCLVSFLAVQSFAQTEVIGGRIDTPPAAHADLVADLRKRVAESKTVEQCASTTVAGNVWIMNQAKNALYCSLNFTDSYIAKMSVSSSLLTDITCVWRMVYCVTNAQALFQYFVHLDANNVSKFMVCVVEWGNVCVQLNLDQSQYDTGHFFRFDQVTGGKQLYNPYTGKYIKEAVSSELDIDTVYNASTLRICFTDTDPAYC